MAKNESKNAVSPLERTSRLLDLVPYINTHQGISLVELAEVFEVSTDQMISDLTTLWMCGLPGYTPLELMDLDFESGYVTIRNAPTLARPRSITHEEGVALVLGLDVLRSGISSERLDLIEAIASLSQRIARLVNLPLALSASSNISQEVTTSVKDAIAHRSGLQISYHSLYKDVISSRVILPLEILDSQGYLYLHAYCFTALDFRHFRIDRIQSAHSVEVEKPSTALPVNPEKIGFSVKVVRPTRDVAERFEESNLEAGTVFKGSSFSQHWIARSVLASGGAVELLSPEEIRSELAKRAELILNRYEG
ncbi:proteasome accessory factor C [Candidatus Planktophila dulcis]|uniref:Proteasome accessory factor C n=1 Tax=Candidatus Planktophila dulcis TaxID=1884914 RepID=A0AAC9YT64_9ACTN|nr:WYL domain-containing protein [Candidatus Planktophila dulcis]ASY12010.1 proteasome accessory factor C [Candidatus Planktophila dulcis]ASY21253.1 proteasome accessory factor C [Candidatus Planktophila dulcis]